MRHVLVVDDDPAMRNMVSAYFRDQDLDVTSAANGSEMLQAIASRSIDLVILDLKLGHEDGMELLRTARPKLDMPLIIISGHRREEVDRIVGLELGADDFVTKPFGLRELLARARAVLRRYESQRAVSTGKPARLRHQFAGWTLTEADRRLIDPDGTEVPLTAHEYALLMAFLQTPGQVLSREQLLAGSRLHDDVFERSIDVQVLRLRRKLEADPSHPAIIRTQRGVGYIFAAPVERVTA
jgi:two-component system OmpR family response regulator